MRRSRFTVYRKGLDPVVCMTYTAESARAFYERNGQTVTRVVKGDHRVEARNAAIKAAGGFRLDRAALQAACAELGLKLPVKVRFNSRVGGTNGNYRFMGTHHDVMLKSYRTPQQATATLWHELCHAMQAERAGGTPEWAKVRAEQQRVPYSRRPIEVEARRFAAERSNRPLTRPL